MNKDLKKVFTPITLITIGVIGVFLLIYSRSLFSGLGPLPHIAFLLSLYVGAIKLLPHPTNLEWLIESELEETNLPKLTLSRSGLIVDKNETFKMIFEDQGPVLNEKRLLDVLRIYRAADESQDLNRLRLTTPHVVFASTKSKKYGRMRFSVIVTPNKNLMSWKVEFNLMHVDQRSAFYKKLVTQIKKSYTPKFKEQFAELDTRQSS